MRLVTVTEKWLNKKTRNEQGGAWGKEKSHEEEKI